MTRNDEQSVRGERVRLAMQQGMLWSAKPARKGLFSGLVMLAGGIAYIVSRPFALVFRLAAGLTLRAPSSARGAQREKSAFVEPDIREAKTAEVSGFLPTPRVAAVTTALITLVFSGFWIAHSAQASERPHTLIAADGFAVEIVAPETHPSELVARYGISMGPYDRLLVEDHPSGRVIRVDRMYPTYIRVDGELRDVWMSGGTVGDALNRAGILVREEDMVIPDVEAALVPGQDIDIVRVERDQTIETQKIDFKTIRKPDSTIEVGKREIKQKGIDGERRIVTEYVYHDGELYATNVLSDEIVTEAQTLVIHEGTKPKATPTPKAKATPTPEKRYTKVESVSKPDADGYVTIVVGGKSYKAKPLKVESTAYTHTGRKTATGTTPKVGTIAVDRDVIPLGTKMFVPGYGMGKAEDVGVGGYQIDVFLDTYQQCKRWGRKYDITIYILK